MFRKMPFILLSIIILSGLFHQWIPLAFQSFLYSLSLTLKSIIVFVLPFLIFGLLFKTTFQLSKKASRMILFIFTAICVSNFFSTLISYNVGSFSYSFDLSMQFPFEGEELKPLWLFSFPKWIGNGQAMFAAVAMGLLLGRWNPHLAQVTSLWFEKIINKVLTSFLYVIPVFITGFVLKMYHDQIMVHIIRNYFLIFAIVAMCCFAYISLMYLMIHRFQAMRALRSMKNMLPSVIAGFGSMSSAAAMPLTILGVEKNSENSDLARSVIPATSNTHLIGDCFAIPIFAFAVLKGFGIAEPTFISYLIFALYFVLAKFSVAAVPGGGILVMLPILENTLGFNAEMLSLITALYILFDPVITGFNILGNGAFALGMGRLLKRQTEKLAL